MDQMNVNTISVVFSLYSLQTFKTFVLLSSLLWPICLTLLYIKNQPAISLISSLQANSTAVRPFFIHQQPIIIF